MIIACTRVATVLGQIPRMLNGAWWLDCALRLPEPASIITLKAIS
jgi:hypothetical protein